MKNKTQLIFMIGASVAAVLAIACAVLLFLSYGKLKKTEKAIAKGRKALATFYSKNPFPSDENVAVEQKNGEALKTWFESLMRQAGEGQLNLDMRRPSQFMALLGETRADLIKTAGADVVDSAFAFGFDRYLEEGSELPSPDHVPRLAQQLTILDRICRVLFEEGITRLETTHREQFEGRAVAARRRSGTRSVDVSAGELREGDLHAKLHFRLEFEAPESAVVGVLNRMASNELFIVVGKLDCEKTGDDINEGRIPEPGDLELDPDREDLEVDQQGRLFPSRYDRVISGSEMEIPLNVKLEFDVYRFAEVAAP